MKIKFSVFVGLVTLIVTAGCGGNANQLRVAEQCVVPPISTSKSDINQAMKLAAKLEKLNIDVNLEESFKKIAETGYHDISEKNTTLLILINGANCLAKRPGVGQEMAKKLIDAAYSLALGKLGVAGGAFDRTISPTQAQAILTKGGSGATQVLEELQNAGYKMQE